MLASTARADTLFSLKCILTFSICHFTSHRIQTQSGRPHGAALPTAGTAPSNGRAVPPTAASAAVPTAPPVAAVPGVAGRRSAAGTGACAEGAATRGGQAAAAGLTRSKVYAATVIWAPVAPITTASALAAVRPTTERGAPTGPSPLVPLTPKGAGARATATPPTAPPLGAPTGVTAPGSTTAVPATAPVTAGFLVTGPRAGRGFSTAKGANRAAPVAARGAGIASSAARAAATIRGA